MKHRGVIASAVRLCTVVTMLIALIAMNYGYVITEILCVYISFCGSILSWVWGWQNGSQENQD